MLADTDTRFAGISGTGNDIARLTDLFESLDQAVAIFDKNDTPIWFSPRIIQIASETMHVDESSQLMQLSNRMNSAMSDLSANGSFCWNNKYYRVSAVNVSDWFDEEMHAIAVHSLSESDSLSRQYLIERESLFNTSRAVSVSEMASALAHELNQPIGSIVNILTGLRSRLVVTSENTEISNALDKMEEQARFAADVIIRIRDFTHKRQPKREKLSVSQIITESLRLLDWYLENKNVHVVKAASLPVFTVVADPTMLHQVFTNLIRNASEAMCDLEPSMRRLVVEIDADHSHCYVRIKDYGHGLSESSDGGLFHPFMTTKPGGMGIGLSICRSFIELHNGRLWLSQNDGAGCTATVKLPLTTN